MHVLIDLHLHAPGGWHVKELLLIISSLVLI